MGKNNKIFKWGIIGTGGIANAFANDINLLDGHKISAVLSRSKNTAQKFAAQLENCKSFVDIKSFVSNNDIDAIYIATPNTYHAEQTIISLKAKKPVLCEKPFAMNAQEVLDMIETSKTYDTTLLEGMWTRYLPHINTIKNIIKDGKIGKIESIFACHGQNLRHSNNPRLWTKKLGGGALLDLGIYVVSFAHMILGKPKEIIATSTFTDRKVDGKTSMIFKYENDIIANLSCSMFDTQPNRAIISGDKGLIEIDPTFYAPTSFTLDVYNEKKLTFVNNYKGHGLREQAKEMQKCISQGLIESPKISHLESYAIMKSMDSVRKIIGLHFKG